MKTWSREFAGRPECLVEARQFILAVLGECDEAHTVALVADELAGNAIKHTASGTLGGEFVLRLARFGKWCRVRVDDQGGPTMPALCSAAEQDEAGRGLTIVETLSTRWGVEGDEHARSVWAEITFNEAPFDERRAMPAPESRSVTVPAQAKRRRRVGRAANGGVR